MKERTLLPVAIIGVLVLWLATVGLWAVDAQKIDQSSRDRLPGEPVEAIEWKLVTTWPKGLPGLGAAPENFARRINEASGGRRRIKVSGAGASVPAR